MSNRRLAIVNPLISRGARNFSFDVASHCPLKSEKLSDVDGTSNTTNAHEPLYGEKAFETVPMEPFNTRCSHPCDASYVTHDCFSGASECRIEPVQSTSNEISSIQPPTPFRPPEHEKLYANFLFNNNEFNLPVKQEWSRETERIPSASVHPVMRREPTDRILEHGSNELYYPHLQHPVISRPSAPCHLYGTSRQEQASKSRHQVNPSPNQGQRGTKQRAPAISAYRYSEKNLFSANHSCSAESVSPNANSNATDSSLSGKSMVCKKDFAVQTDGDRTELEEFSDESGDSDESEGSESENARRLPIKPVPCPPKDETAPSHLPWELVNMTEKMDSEHLYSSQKNEQKVTPTVPTETSVIWPSEIIKRNSMTSLDSGRDSTYAGSSEGSGVQSNYWFRPSFASGDKVISTANSPTDLAIYRQHCSLSPQQASVEQLNVVEATLKNQASKTLLHKPFAMENPPKIRSQLAVCDSSDIDEVPCPISQDVEYERYRCSFRDTTVLPNCIESIPKSYSQQPLASNAPNSTQVACNVASWQSVDEQKQVNHWLRTIGLSRLEGNISTAGFSLWTLCRTTPEELNACGITSPYDRQILRAELNRLNLPDPLPTRLPKNVRGWLYQLNLDQYWPHLRDQGFISFEQLIRLTWEDLDEVGITKLGHQKKFLLGIAKLRHLINLSHTTKLHSQPVMVSPNESLGPSQCIPSSKTVGLTTQSCWDRGRKFAVPSLLVIDDDNHHVNKSDNDDDFPVPEPPPAFQDVKLDETVSSNSCQTEISRLRLPLEPTVSTLPPSTPSRRSSVVSADESQSTEIRYENLKKHLPYYSITNRRSFTSLRHDMLGSEPNLYNGINNRRSSSPSITPSTDSHSNRELTKWSSGHITTPLLRLPNTYQNAYLDPELRDMRELRAMLDALSENLATSTRR